MDSRTPLYCGSIDKAVDIVVHRIGKDIRLGVPLGLGKPNQFVNALYRRAVDDPSLSLTIYTALSLNRPRAENDLEGRFLEPFVQRIYDDYEDLDYVKAEKSGALPDNIRVLEFFFAPGSMLGSRTAQEEYISSNYTHAARDLNARGINVMAQLVASRDMDGDRRFSLSCNPEISLDLHPMMLERRNAGETVMVVAQVHEELPYMPNDAEVGPGFFDLVIDDAGAHTQLFTTPNMPVALQDHFVGLHASTLIRDGGTLQIGIGALGDALVHHMLVRHHDNERYREILDVLGHEQRFGDLVRSVGGTESFDRGLYGCSEMFTYGLMELIDGDVIRRPVYPDENLQRLFNAGKIDRKVTSELLDTLRENGVIDRHLDDAELDWLYRFGIFSQPVHLENDQLVLPNDVRISNDLEDRASREALKAVLGDEIAHGIIMHGGFYLGPGAFYRRLREMPEALRRQINMTHISYVNHLYGDEELKRLQRPGGRFMNTAFTVTLLGSVVSDQLGDGRVLSGVGGQYNFVAQAHELEGARSVIMLRSWRERGGEPASNIVFSYPHNTIPRHLRDMVVTEYGIADLRARTDSECVAALLNIADSRFQPELLQRAKKAGKIAADYSIPEQFRHNTPERLQDIRKYFRDRDVFPLFPLGTDFTNVEQELIPALNWLKEKASHRNFLELGRKAFFEDDHENRYSSHLERMSLLQSDGVKQRLYKRLLIAALEENG